MDRERLLRQEQTLAPLKTFLQNKGHDCENWTGKTPQDCKKKCECPEDAALIIVTEYPEGHDPFTQPWRYADPDSPYPTEVQSFRGERDGWSAILGYYRQGVGRGVPKQYSDEAVSEWTRGRGGEERRALCCGKGEAD
jgi:hypothetical protein